MNTSPDFLNALAWALVHFVWQGAAIAALAAGLMFVFRSPAARYLLGVGALAVMLASFAVTFSSLRDPSGSGAEIALTTLPVPVDAIADAAEVPAPLLQIAAPLASEHDFLWVARAWLIGVFALAARIAFGLVMLEHLRRRGLLELPEPLVARFRALQQRVGIRRLVRFAECHAVAVPAVIGLFRPIVLIPVRALTGLSPEQLEAVVAHELGHIKRFDVAVNFVQALAETLFFFHPAVWWLNGRIRADREDCCDDLAVSVSDGRVGYARALATMATWRDAPQLAMSATGSPVAARVARLLGMRHHDTGARSAGVFTVSLVLAAALIAGSASLFIARPAQAQGAVAESPTPPVPVVESVPAVPAAPAARPAKAVKAAKPVRVVKPTALPRPASNARPAVEARPAKPPHSASGASYIDDMKAIGIDNLDVDSLIALRSMGVTPDYVREIRGVGFDPNVHEIIAMKAQGVSADYVKQMRSLDFQPNAHEIIAMAAQGVTSEYVRDIRASGFKPNTHEIIAMKAQDVSPEFRKGLEAKGFKLGVEELIRARAMDITPEFIDQARAHGFKDLSMDKLIKLKVADIF